MPGKSLRAGCCMTETVLSVVILTAAATNLPAESLFLQQDLFISGHDDVNIYRIPSLIVSPQGTIVVPIVFRATDENIRSTNFIVSR